MVLCKYCRWVIPEPIWYEGAGDSISHQSTFRALQKSSQQCQLCKLLLTAWMRGQDPGGEFFKLVDEPHGISVVPIEGFMYGGEERFLNIHTKDFRDWPGQKVFLLSNKWFSRPIWSKREHVVIEDTIPIIQNWLKLCEEKHTSCSHSAAILPARVIDLAAENHTGICLEQSPKGRQARYAALSYCWGTSALSHQTTKATVNDRLEGIVLASLPKTIQDAISVARLLSIRYLWVDSLCIIQDDKTDWEQESKTMSEVYQHAYITLAATAASDCHQGFPFPREPSLYLPDQTIETSNESRNSGKRARIPADTKESLLKSPLFKRGWVLQEMVLSRRTIHFAEEQIFWQCHQLITSEDGTVDYEKRNVEDGTRYYGIDEMRSGYSQREPYNSWWSWVKSYTSRQLTRSEDKFPALAGVTTFFAAMAGDTPVAGLWMNNLHFDLLWYTDQPRKRLLTSGIPSWSWASMNVPITSPYCSPRSEEIVYKLRTINLDLQWSGTSLTSQIVKGVLTVEGRTRTLTVGPPREPMFMHNYDLLPRRQVGPESDEIELGCCAFDEEPPLVGSDILCLEVCHSQDWKKENGYYMLLLASTSHDTDEYLRLGVGFIRTSPRKEYFDGIPLRTIALI